MRVGHLRRQYGITAEQYDTLLAAQGGVCAVCQRPETRAHKSGELYELAVDHDHATGAVRGFLCGLCNQAIGFMDDDPGRLIAAAEYLRSPRKSAILPSYRQPELDLQVRMIPTYRGRNR